MIEIGPDSQTRRGNRIFRHRIPVDFSTCRFSLTSYPKQAAVKSHLEGQDKPDKKPNYRADEVRTAQQLFSYEGTLYHQIFGRSPVNIKDLSSEH